MITTKTPNMKFSCQKCGWNAPKWTGKCTQCGSWDSLAENLSSELPQMPACTFALSETIEAETLATGINEIDRVFGGGLVKGGVILITGEPGIGKSTLLLQTAAQCAQQNSKVLYICAEESSSQVKTRANRINALSENVFITSDLHLKSILSLTAQDDFDLVICDSIQAIKTHHSGTGNVIQLSEITSELSHQAKQRNFSLILVGHITKNGSIAGPKTLEHLVDTVVHLSGDRFERLRILRCIKNRFGSTEEIGCFSMAENGMHPLANPHEYLLTKREKMVSGTNIYLSLEGKRPLAIEIQSLVTISNTARRVTNGLEYTRCLMILAILEKKLNMSFQDKDIYISTTGGIKLNNPSCDLPMALSIISSAVNIPLPSETVAFGEINLIGEIRRTPNLQRRIHEAEKLNLQPIIAPAEQRVLFEEQTSTPYTDTKLQNIIWIHSIEEILDLF